MTNTVIGNSIIIDGDFSSQNNVVIDGTVKGQIHVKGDLYVGRDGSVEADINTQSIEISGQVRGNISALKKVEIATGGRAVGNVQAERILIADGAVFKGNVDMGV